MSRRLVSVTAELAARAAGLGLRVFAYAPGDGARRYRLVLASDCGPWLASQASKVTAGGAECWHDAAGLALVSLVGPRAVRDWLAGYAAGLVDGRLQAIREGAARRAPATAPAGGAGSLGVAP